MENRNKTVEAPNECRSTPKVSKRKHNEPCWSSKKQKCKNNGSDKESQIATVSMNMLNDDCLRAVFSYLPINDLIKLERVSKRWKQIIETTYKQFKRINMENEFGKKYNIRNLNGILKRIGEYLIHLELPPLEYNMPYRVAFGVMKRYCTNLKHLKVDIYINAPNDLNGISKQIAQNLKSLHIVNHGNICDGALSLILKKTTNLEELNITAMTLKGSSLSKLPTTLKTLSISNCGWVKSTHLAKALEKLPNLQNLDVSYCGYMKPSALLSVCKQLVSLNIEDVEDFFFDVRPYKGIQFEDLTFPKLKILNVSEVFLDGRIFEELIEKCPLLENLSLRVSNDVKDDEFRKLDNLKYLVRLDITGTQIGDEALLHVASMSGNFEEIRCSNCKNITQDGLIRLIDFSPKLEYLKIGPSKRLESGFFKSALKSVEERSDQKLLTIEISFSHFWDVVEAKWVWHNEAERLNLIKGEDQSSTCNRLKIKPTFREKEQKKPLSFWCVNSMAQ